MVSGYSEETSSGAITMRTANGGTDGVSGLILFSTGDTMNTGISNTGSINLETGDSAVLRAGDMNLLAGQTADGQGADVSITAGETLSDNSGGRVLVAGGQGSSIISGAGGEVALVGGAGEGGDSTSEGGYIHLDGGVARVVTGGKVMIRSGASSTTTIRLLLRFLRASFCLASRPRCPHPACDTTFVCERRLQFRRDITFACEKHLLFCRVATRRVRDVVGPQSNAPSVWIDVVKSGQVNGRVWTYVSKPGQVNGSVWTDVSKSGEVNGRVWIAFG